MTSSQPSNSPTQECCSPRRVLHLVDCPGRDGGAVVSGPLRDLLVGRPDDRVVFVGGTNGAGNTPHLVPSRRRLMGIGDGGLLRLLRSAADTGCQFDVVHAWGQRATSLVGGSRLNAAPVASLDGFCSDAPEAMAAATVLRSGRVESLFATHRAQRIAMGLIGMGSSRSGRERVACPAVDPAAIEDRRNELRQRWGAAEDSTVIGVIGAPMDQINLRDKLGLPARYSLLGKHVILVVSSRGARRGDMVRWIEQVGHRLALVFDDIMEDTSQVVRAIDAAVAPAAVSRRTRICDVVPVMTAVAAGVPVVLGADHPAVEYADREDLLRAGSEHDDHDSMRWLIRKLAGPPREFCSHSAADRYARYCKAIDRLYARAVAGNGVRWTGESRAMAAS